MKSVFFPDVAAEIKGGISVTHSFIQTAGRCDFAPAVIFRNLSTKSRVLHMFDL